MSYRIRKTDANQQQIVDTFRALGCSVEPKLAQIGQGVPDILVGKDGWTIPVEVKNPAARPDLTCQEEAWRKAWKGSYAIIETPEQAHQLVADMTLRAALTPPGQS